MLLQSFVMISLSIVICMSVYQILPSLACRLSRKLSMARLIVEDGNLEQAGMTIRILGILPASIKVNLFKWLRMAGYSSQTAVMGYLAVMMAPVALSVAAGALAGPIGRKAIWFALASLSLINIRINSRIKQRQKAFTQSLYKIYRFLDLQIGSGIKVTDALRGLPEAISDRQVRPCLVRFAARFELTLDLDQAMDEIRRSFPGTDCEMLATHLRQCLQTGIAGRSLVRMEELLFSRTFDSMQQDTRHVRTELLMTAILGMSPGIIIFLYPLLHEAMQAMKSVFGSF